MNFILFLSFFNIFINRKEKDREKQESIVILSDYEFDHPRKKIIKKRE